VFYPHTKRDTDLLTLRISYITIVILSMKKITKDILFSKRLRVLIKNKLDLTQVEFCKGVGITQGYLSMVLGGKRGPSADLIIGIFLNYSEYLFWLLTGEENQKNKISNNFKMPRKGQDAINALLEIEDINEQTFRRTVSDLEFIADKLKEGATPGPLIAVSENKPLGELTKEKDNI